MITLPTDWQDKIQLRDWMKPVDDKGKEIALLVLMVRNKDGQAWAYERSVVATDPSLKHLSLHDAYAALVFDAPKAAAKQETAESYNPTHVVAPITNDEWEILVGPNMTFYKPKEF